MKAMLSEGQRLKSVHLTVTLLFQVKASLSEMEQNRNIVRPCNMLSDYTSLP